MSAAETLSSALDAGVRLGLDGVDLLIEADCEPPPHLFDALRRDKPGILALLRTHETGEVPLPAATIETPTISRRPGRRGWTIRELFGEGCIPSLLALCSISNGSGAPDRRGGAVEIAPLRLF